MVVDTFRAAFLGGRPFWVPDANELTTRILICSFFLAAPLFVGIENSPTAWAIGTPLIALPFRIMNRTRFAFRLSRTTLLLAVFVILAGVSACWSISAPRSLHAALVVAGYAILGLMLIEQIDILPDAHRERIWKALLTGGVVAIIFLMAFEIRAGLFLDGVTLVDATLTLHKITFYGLLICAALLGNAELARSRSWLIFAAVAFALPTLVLGRSTGINFAILLIASIYFLHEITRRRVFIAFCVAYVLGALSGPFIAPSIFHALDQTGILNWQTGTFGARLELWSMISHEIFENFWFGHGADTTRSAYYIVQQPKYYTLPDLPSGHNIIFDVWFELGAAGIIVYLLLFAVLARAVLRVRGAAGMASMTVFLAATIELSVDHRIWLSWILGALVFGASIWVLSQAIAGRSTTAA